MYIDNINIFHFCVDVCAYVLYVYTHVNTLRHIYTLFFYVFYGVHRFESRSSLLNLLFSWTIIGALSDKLLLSNLYFE